LKQGDPLWPFIFNFALECHWKVQEIKVRVKSNGTHQLLPYADDVNLLRDNVDTINKNTENLIDASNEVGLDTNAQKTKYVFLARHQYES
jgi:hypothetical protein